MRTEKPGCSTLVTRLQKSRTEQWSGKRWDATTAFYYWFNRDGLRLGPWPLESWSDYENLRLNSPPILFSFFWPHFTFSKYVNNLSSFSSGTKRGRGQLSLFDGELIEDIIIFSTCTSHPFTSVSANSLCCRGRRGVRSEQRTCHKGFSLSRPPIEDMRFRLLSWHPMLLHGLLLPRRALIRTHYWTVFPQRANHP